MAHTAVVCPEGKEKVLTGANCKISGLELNGRGRDKKSFNPKLNNDAKERTNRMLNG